MPELFQYLLESSLILLFLAVFFSLLLEDRLNWKAARFFLLVSPVLAFLIPALHLEGTPLLSSHWMEDILLSDSQSKEVQANNSLSISLIPWGVFLAGLIWRCLNLARTLIRLKSLQKGTQHREGAIRIFTSENIEAPFSFFNRIYLPLQLSAEDRAVILQHEIRHHRAGHSWDLLYYEMLLLLQWFNPAAWMLSASLRQVHEYQADAQLLQTGIDRQAYKQLIFDHLVMGAPFLPLNHFSKNSVKRRFIMMNTTQRSAPSTWRLFGVLPLLALCLSLFSFTQSGPKGGDLDKMPQYPGGQAAMTAYIQEHFAYPEEAKASQIEGKVIVEFTVSPSGKLSKIKAVKGIGYGCDEAAETLVKGMPTWNPGMKDGKAVAVKMTLPFVFALPQGK